ncbi:ABC transporter, ATP-binding protein [Ancylostoma ceylanicum]|uniref:ABC transporter, ATP-binding protein n=1 Tax=Ancylostoma ceylanicum TaxID=53326 RepID=A0A0D6M6Q1_9BILA|nr:ABC transporter, ATP-binding protein [Ancylostoma ceylanicum]
MGLFIVYFDFELTPEIQINGSNVAVDSFNPIERCRSLHLNYMNDGADKEEIESVLEQIPLKNTSALGNTTNTTINYVYAPFSRSENTLDGVKTLKRLSLIILAFGPFLLNTAMNVASEKETGMKEFLLVMGLDKVTLFAETLIFSYSKAFICTCLLLAPLLVELPTESRDDEQSWHQKERRPSTEPDVIVDNVTVLLGHNGAGKSTTYAMICGTTRATNGSITICGLNIYENLHECRRKMGFCPQTNCIFLHLTVDDHLWFFYKLKEEEGDWRKDASDLCENLGMQHLLGRMAGELSGGEKRKLCVAIAFIGNNRLVMLDEPTAGMDPESRRTVELLVEKEKTNRCILLTTHYMDEAEMMGDFVYIMHMGHSVCSGTPLFLKKKLLVKSHVPGSELGDVNGRQLCFQLPKESQKEVGRLMDRDLDINSVPDLEENHEYSSPFTVPDISLRRVTAGKFLVFDVSQDETRRKLVEGALQKFPRLQVLVYNDSDWMNSWPLQWPWVAGGVIIGNYTDQADSPSYAESLCMLYQFAVGFGPFFAVLRGIDESEIPDGEDVIQEKEYIASKPTDLVLSVEGTTYGVRHEECFGLVGASGAGKTTTFEIITGLRFASYGTVTLKNCLASRNMSDSEANMKFTSMS